jgi:hypothetical protein
MGDSSDDDSFPVDLTRREMQDFRDLMHWLQSTNALAFWPDGLCNMEAKVGQTLNMACYRHKVLRERIQIAADHTQVICKQCNPEEYQGALVKMRSFRGE